MGKKWHFKVLQDSFNPISWNRIETTCNPEICTSTNTCTIKGYKENTSGLKLKKPCFTVEIDTNDRKFIASQIKRSTLDLYYAGHVYRFKTKVLQAIWDSHVLCIEVPEDIQIEKDRRDSFRLWKDKLDGEHKNILKVSFKSRLWVDHSWEVLWLNISNTWLKIKGTDKIKLFEGIDYDLEITVPKTILNPKWKKSITESIQLKVKVQSNDSWIYWLLIVWEAPTKWKQIVSALQVCYLKTSTYVI